MRADALCDFSSRTPQGFPLDECRPTPVRQEERAAALATLPRKGEITDLHERDRRKIAAVLAVLDFHHRADVYVIKVIDLPQAFAALHERSILLISRPALQLLEAGQLQALAAHEVGHEYVWNEYRSAKSRADTARLQEIELACDRIAIATLSRMMLSSSVLGTALDKVSRYNREHFGLAINESLYPSLAQRRANIAHMSSEAAWVGAKETNLTFVLQKIVLTLNISFLPAFQGSRLAFKREPQEGEQCFTDGSEQTAKCPENFVGAVAIGQYSVRQRHGHPVRDFRLRERVLTIDQHPDFPKRGDFERTAVMVNGIITDLQMFGYDEASVPVSNKAQERETADKVWGLYRQELYANDERSPFAIIEWKHTIRSITLVRARALPPAVLIQ